MLSRAERSTPIATNGCTNEIVGPGSYVVSESPVKQSFGPSAAFAWAGKRSTLSAAATCSLSAADEYASSVQDPTSPVTRPWTSSTSSCFASSTQRFGLNKEAVAKPGPGAYQTSPQWAKQQAPSWHPAGSTKGPQHTPSAALLGCPVRVPAPTSAAQSAGSGTTGTGVGPSSTAADLSLSTPPSIPARHQSFGYEPGPGGCLIMQPPPSPAAPDAGKSPGATAAGSNSSRSKSAARPSTSQLSRRLQSAAAGGTCAAATGSSPGRTTPAKQLQQQLKAAQEAAARLQLGSTSPRFRCAAGGKLVLSTCSERAGSAAFASKSARLHQQEPDPEKLTPGPGAYTSSSTTPTRPTSAPAYPSTAAAGRPLFSPRQPHPQQQQLFARSAGRSAVLSIGPGWQLPPHKAVAPGPGAYHVSSGSTGPDRAHAQVAKVYGHNCSSQAAALSKAASTAAGSGPVEGAEAATGFGCTSRRFGDDTTASPGPGKYSADQLMSMAADAARRAAAASRRGAFGSADNRQHCSVIEECLGGSSSSSGGGGGCSGIPGPGCYDVRSGLADRVAAAAVRQSAGFASASERFTAAAAPIAAPDYSSFDGHTLRGDQSRLGPGAYLQLDDWRRGAHNSTAGRSGYHQAPFGSESGQHVAAGVATAAEDAPGPGAYASVDVTKVFQPLSLPGKTGFCTTSQQFKLKAATPETVGPGTYMQHSSLVKPTFNVTLDQP